MKFLSAALVATLASAVYARTDIEGCISSATTNQWHEASMIWYVPGTGEICDFPDCGGGRGPPKYDDPACPGYTGTATYEPSYLPGYGPGATVSASTLAATATPSDTTTGDVVVITSTAASTTTKMTTASSIGSSGTSVLGSASTNTMTPSASSSVTASPSLPAEGAADFLKYNVISVAGIAAVLGVVFGL